MRSAIWPQWYMKECAVLCCAVQCGTHKSYHDILLVSFFRCLFHIMNAYVRIHTCVIDVNTTNLNVYLFVHIIWNTKIDNIFVIKWREQNTENKTGSNRFRFNTPVAQVSFYYIRTHTYIRMEKKAHIYLIVERPIDNSMCIFTSSCIPLLDHNFSIARFRMLSHSKYSINWLKHKTNKIC